MIMVPLFTILLLFLSCTKEKDTNSKLDLLTGKQWKWIKIEYRQNNDPWEDEVQYWPDCQKDDEVTFYRNGSFELNEGATRCDPNDPQIQDQLRWTFRENETKIELDGTIWNIELLEEDQFVFSASESIGTNTFSSRYTLK